MGVNVSQVESVIRALSPEKPAGLDGLAYEHLEYTRDRLTALSMWLTSILVHTYVYDDLSRVTDSNNFTPIALAKIFSKLLEHVYCRFTKDCVE